MLVLSRHQNESIVIADGLITVVVVDIRGDRVRLAIDAPESVSVHRKEIFRSIQATGGNDARLRFQPAVIPQATVLTDRELILEFPNNQHLRQAFDAGLVRFNRKRA